MSINHPLTNITFARAEPSLDYFQHLKLHAHVFVVFVLSPSPQCQNIGLGGGGEHIYIYIHITLFCGEARDECTHYITVRLETDMYIYIY